MWRFLAPRRSLGAVDQDIAIVFYHETKIEPTADTAIIPMHKFELTALENVVNFVNSVYALIVEKLNILFHWYVFYTKTWNLIPQSNIRWLQLTKTIAMKMSLVWSLIVGILREHQTVPWKRTSCLPMKGNLMMTPLCVVFYSHSLLWWKYIPQ